MACGSMVEGGKAAGEDTGQGAACTCSTPAGVSHMTQEWDPRALPRRRRGAGSHWGGFHRLTQPRTRPLPTHGIWH